MEGAGSSLEAGAIRADAVIHCSWRHVGAVEVVSIEWWGALLAGQKTVVWKRGRKD